MIIMLRIYFVNIFYLSSSPLLLVNRRKMKLLPGSLKITLYTITRWHLIGYKLIYLYTNKYIFKIVSMRIKILVVGWFHVVSTSSYVHAIFIRGNVWWLITQETPLCYSYINIQYLATLPGTVRGLVLSFWRYRRLIL